MNAAQTLLIVIWIGLTLYVLLGGADFGAGFWDLSAGRGPHGRRQRDLINEVIGPVWEANNVWLIFILVLLWTGFPPVFSAVMSTLYIPLTLAVIGIIARGSSFAFRHVISDPARRVFGTAFATSSILTPFFMATVVGGIASGRVPPGIAAGDLVTSWLNPTSILSGVLAVGTCAYLASAYLCRDAQRSSEPDLAALFRRRAIVTGIVVGAVLLIGTVVLHADAPRLFHGLTHRALPLVLLSALSAIASFVLLLTRHYVLVRPVAALAVAAVIWSWAVAQYPIMLYPSLTFTQAAAGRPVLAALVPVVAVGALLLIPSLGWLFILFQHSRPATR
jgi:cytochrome d ubiquinol oxidase subunit II